MTDQVQRPNVISTTPALKIVVLAAAQRVGLDMPYPRAMQKLGDRVIIDYVLDLAHHFAPPVDTYVIVGYEHRRLEEYLGPAYTYVLQPEALGTAHAVRQVEPLLQDHGGDLLILYGDTPLFRLSSLRGMLVRHRQTQAALTLLSCVTDQPLPYGRVLRDETGRVIDVIEEADASEQVRLIRELNLGAYVVQAPLLFHALQDTARRHETGGYLLTDVVGQLARQGHKVECYQCADQDEALGINTPLDLERAELILQKRVLSPKRVEEENIIQFGTGGWRAVIGEAFNLHNVRRLSQALANRLLRLNMQEQGALIGYDHRFLSDTAAAASAEVFAGNNIRTILLPEAAPTPLITYATVEAGAGYGLAFTASHNPPDWNGLKVFRQDGALPLDDETSEIEQEANALTDEDIVKIELPLALATGRASYQDYTNQYVDAVEAFVDLKAIRNAGLRIIVDPMYGVGQVTINLVLTEARCRVLTIHDRHDPLFGGRSPAPNLEALGLLIHYMRDGRYDLGLATDGDADRIAIVDEKGNYVSVNDLLVLLYWYMHEVRGEKGPVVRNLATTHMLDRLARGLGEQCIEVPVGFKHIAAAMTEHGAILGGESSGGLTIRGHILGKDGILAAALIVEMLAKTGDKISNLLERIFARFGRLYAAELNLPATPEMKVLFPRHLRQKQFERIGPCTVQSLSTLDGFKFLLEDDQWVLLRFSGTEPLLRIFVEGNSPSRAEELLAAAQTMLPM